LSTIGSHSPRLGPFAGPLAGQFAVIALPQVVQVSQRPQEGLVLPLLLGRGHFLAHGLTVKSASMTSSSSALWGC